MEKAEIRDIFSLARICDALNKCPAIIDVIGQLYHPISILGPLEDLCNNWKPADSEMELDGRSGFDSPSDEDTDGVQVLYGKYGKIWTLAILVLNKFNVCLFSYRNYRCCCYFVGLLKQLFILVVYQY